MGKETNEKGEDGFFLRHMEDLFLRAQHTWQTGFSGFLDLHQLMLARRVAAGREEALFYGGYPQAERLMLGVFPPGEGPEEGEFPIRPVTVTFRTQEDIGHRDILGSLLGLGLKRETVGDILLEPGRAVAFMTPPAAKTAANELKQVGRCGVAVGLEIPKTLPLARRYEEKKCNVASLRLDCVVSALTGLSREGAARLIRSSLAAVNGAPEPRVDYTLCEGDVLSLRGHGKFLFQEVSGTSKKGRLFIICQKYI